MTEVLAVYDWPTNAALIADVNRLHPLGDAVLDATYGRGRWWQKHRPPVLITNDLNPKTDTDYHYDFQAFPQNWTDQFDGVAFDPPYKLNGTPTLGDFDNAYGIAQPTNWRERMLLIRNGFRECLRVVKPAGRVYVKCQDQVVSGRMRWQTHTLITEAEQRGARLVDRFDMLGGTRPQPEGRRQVHARGRGSTLLVFSMEVDQ